jgi:peptidoglycan-N-acetylglucosamine deacetylase
LKYKPRIFILIVFTILYLGTIKTVANSKTIIKDPDASSNLNSVEKKTVYLTFDDGPSYIITPKILDILKENNVKATFFVVGSQINDRKEILKRIYEEGNSIGLHTYSHKYVTVYKSNDIFLNEMKKTADLIYSILGISPKIIRFPGGSKKHLNKVFEMRIKELGYKIYDWNISASDGFNNNIPAENIFNNCIKNKEKFSRVIITMHCAAENIETVKALPRIIQYYKKANYEFKVIDDKTPEYYFKY